MMYGSIIPEVYRTVSNKLYNLQLPLENSHFSIQYLYRFYYVIKIVRFVILIVNTIKIYPNKY